MRKNSVMLLWRALLTCTAFAACASEQVDHAPPPSEDAPTECVPIECQASWCGDARDNGCGEPLLCGECAGELTCGGGGTAGVCGSSTFGFTVNSTTNRLVRIRMETGELTDLGPLGVDIDHLAYEPTTATLYGVGEKFMYTIDTASGATELAFAFADAIDGVAVAAPYLYLANYSVVATSHRVVRRSLTTFEVIDTPIEGLHLSNDNGYYVCDSLPMTASTYASGLMIACPELSLNETSLSILHNTTLTPFDDLSGRTVLAIAERDATLYVLHSENRLMTIDVATGQPLTERTLAVPHLRGLVVVP